MAATSPIEQAARQAAQRHYELVLSMLEQGQSGVVTTVIEGGFLQPEQTVRKKSKAIRVAVGQLAKIETVR